MTYPQPAAGFEWTPVPWGHVLRCQPLADVAEHFFTTRDVLLTDDASEWAAVAAAMAIAPERLRLIRQVHRIDVAIARRGDSGPWVRPEADVIVSNDEQSAVGVRVADCAPVLLADRRLGVVAAAHAGWRGTVQRAAATAVAALAREFGSRPMDLVAAIGPCLGSCCGEVGDEVVRAFLDAGHARSDVSRWFTAGPTSRAHLDLALANVDQLNAAGVPGGSIHVANLCSKTHADRFHSYRAHGAAAGRMVGVIRPTIR